MVDWRKIEEHPPFPTPVILYFAGREFKDMSGREVSLGEVRDAAERMEVGFWDGHEWCEAGTGHPCFEDWRIENGDTPTHWAPAAAP